MALIMVSKTNCKQLFLAVSLMMTLPVQAELLSAQLVKAALERTAHVVRYDGSYRSISYPNGDVPDNIGVCTDVVSSSAENYLPGDLVTWMLPGNRALSLPSGQLESRPIHSGADECWRPDAIIPDSNNCRIAN